MVPLILASFLLTSMVQAAPVCSQVFVSSAATMGKWQQAKVWFQSFFTKKQVEAKNSPVETRNEIDQPFAIIDQCEFGTCSIHATLTQLEQLQFFLSKNKIPLSHEYIISAFIKERFAAALAEVMNSPESTTIPGIQFGSNTAEVLKTIADFGARPASSWQLPEQKPRYFNESALISKLRALLYKVKPQLENAEMTPAQAFAEADKIIASFFGSPLGEAVAMDDPDAKEFSYDGRDFSAKQFAQEKFHFAILKNLKQIMISSAKNGDPYRDAAGIWTQDMTAALALRRIQKEIGDGKSVQLDLLSARAQIDNKTGWITKAASPTDSRGDEGAHAIVVVSFTLNAKKEIDVLRLQNTRGVSSGDNGYYYIHASDFDRLIRSVSVFSTPTQQN